MTTFYICRHGQTENNKNNRFSGWIDTPLTDEGNHNAVSIAKKLAGVQFDHIISSDLGRTFITAYIVACRLGFTGNIQRAKELREINYGDFANKPYSLYPNLSPTENSTFVCPGGESLAIMQKRVSAYIHKLGADNLNKTILLVAHDGTINAALADCTGQDIGIVDITHNAHDFVGKFAYQHGRLSGFTEVKV